MEREGARLLENDIGIAASLGVSASPTWIVNGKHQFRGLDAETIRRNFCEHNERAAGCANTLSGPGEAAPASGGCGE